jgi:hypothetical protein
MDQIKTALAQLKRFHFWILCGVIAAMGLGSWYMTQASLHTEFEANKTEIDGTYTIVQQLNSQQFPPNPNVHQGMGLRIGDLQQSVMAVWKSQYDHQKKSTLMWPQELTREFRRAVEPLRPIEEKFAEYPTPDEKEIKKELRQEYANYIYNELPKLAEVIGAKWEAVAPVGGGGFGEGPSYGGDMSSSYGPSYGASSPMSGPSYGAGGVGGAKLPEETSVVDWNASNQGQLMAKFNWAQQGGAPTTLQVLYAQEDLWVLKNLMEIIKNTNDGATERHKAYIRKIESIQLGREAAGRTGRITPIAAAAMGALGPGGAPSSDYMPEMSSESMTSSESSTGTMADLAEGSSGVPSYGAGAMGGGARDPAEGRYVDKDYKPLAAAKIRSDVTTNPAEVYLAVAKRMPVRLVCQIDQRKIHKLIAECGNSPLTVEVRQVRIGGNAGKGGQGGGSFGSGMYSGMDYSSGYGDESSSDSGTIDMSSMMGGYGSGYGAYGGSSAARAMSQAMNDITVEIYGIVYIYNPVNQKALGIDATQSGSGGAQPGALTADAGPAGAAR